MSTKAPFRRVISIALLLATLLPLAVWLGCGPRSLPEDKVRRLLVLGFTESDVPEIKYQIRSTTGGYQLVARLEVANASVLTSLWQHGVRGLIHMADPEKSHFDLRANEYGFAVDSSFPFQLHDIEWWKHGELENADVLLVKGRNMLTHSALEWWLIPRASSKGLYLIALGD